MARLDALREGFGAVNEIITVIFQAVWQSMRDYHLQRLQNLPRTLPYIPAPTIDAPPYDPNGPPSPETGLILLHPQPMSDSSSSPPPQLEALYLKFSLQHFELPNLDSQTVCLGLMVLFFLLATIYPLYDIVVHCIRQKKESKAQLARKQEDEALSLADNARLQLKNAQLEAENNTLWQDKRQETIRRLPTDRPTGYRATSDTAAA